MSYTIETLELQEFRNYNSARIEFDSNLTILHGPNAAGKTNIIEALQLLCTGESFRKPTRQELINTKLVESDQPEKYVKNLNSCILNKEEIRNQCCVTLRASDGVLKRDIELYISEKSKTFLLNEKKVRLNTEFAAVLPCVVFTPDDLRIVKESASRRRQEIDDLGSQLSTRYGNLTAEYRKIVTQRNKLLKENQYRTEVFEAWTERLIDVGVALNSKRNSLFDRIIPHVLKYYDALLDENQTDQQLTIYYESTWGEAQDEADFRATLEARANDEIIRKQSLVGPHRDDLIFEIAGRPSRNFASQGQQRSIVLAWKLAQLAVIEEITQTRPLLLLDDVMSEFDQMRRHFLTSVVGEVAQTVITTANIDYFNQNLINRARTICIPDDIVLALLDEEEQM